MRLPSATTFIWLTCFAALVGWFFYNRYQTPCHRTLEYAIGQFDTRFGESEADFRQALESAAAVWEEPTGFDLFTYNSQADFKVNLIFDERQQTVNEQNQLEDEIVSGSESFETQKAQYDSKRAEYERRSAKLSEQIAFYNANGGAPPEKHAELESERHSLNKLADSLNTLADQLQVHAGALNSKIESFNTHVGHVFDQANYTGDEINLYEFENQQDLVLALAHEFGHALTIEHVSDPKAIMYYLLQEQNAEQPRLAEADVNALQQACTPRSATDWFRGRS
ncbi:MAG: matrixin family metalloprotease [Patescibacteria group bacterium]